MTFIMDLYSTLALLALSLTFACQYSSSARYYAKSTFLYLFLWTNSLVTIPYGLYHFRQFHKTCLFAGARVHWANRVLGVDWTVETTDKYDKTKSYVVVCNHQSALDVLGMMELWPVLGPTVTTAKSELKYLGPFGLSLFLCGVIFVDRHKETGKQAVNAAGKCAKESGVSVWVFPEGTRSGGKDLLPFKKGAFHMALDAGMPILPIVISRYDFLSTRERKFEKGRVRIQVLEPIETDSYSKENMDELIEVTRSTMEKTLGEISGYTVIPNSR